MPAGDTKRILLAVILLSAMVFCQSRELRAGLTHPGDVPERISWPRAERLLAGRGFASGDELFQLLCLLADQQDAFRLDRPVLSRLESRMTTLFPLAACQLIELRDGRLHFRFAGPQQVVVPHTWRQASLFLSDRLVLSIMPEPLVPEGAGGDGVESDPGTRTVRLHVEEGTLRLHFSFLLKWLRGPIRDAEGTQLVYRINEVNKISRLQLIEHILLTRQQLKLATDPEPAHRGRVWIDIDHPDFPDSRDIGIDDSRISFFGTEVELLPDMRIRIGDEAPRKDEKAWHWFSQNLTSFRKLAETSGSRVSLRYTRNFGYFFEERRMVMTMSFEGEDADRPPTP